MTNGSSQGLFVIVAVVIFGIFVAISYSLFRDQVTPSLASIFKDSISEAENKLQLMSDNLVFDNIPYKFSLGTKQYLFVLNSINPTEHTLNNFEASELIGTNEFQKFGLNLGSFGKYKPKTTYLFSFDVILEKGVLEHMGGRLKGEFGHTIDNLKINGVEYNNGKYDTKAWDLGIEYPFKIGEVVNFSMEITTGTTEPEGTFYVQPNRYSPNPTTWEVRIKNLNLQEIYN